MKNNTLLIGLGLGALTAYVLGNLGSSTNSATELPLKVRELFIPGIGMVDVGILNLQEYYKINNVWVPAATLNNAFQAAQQNGNTGGQNFGQWVLANADDLIQIGIDLFGDLFGNGNN